MGIHVLLNSIVQAMRGSDWVKALSDGPIIKVLSLKDVYECANE